MLYIIGLGLGDEKDITLRGLEAVKSCHKIYIEAYTSLLSFGVSSDGLSKLVNFHRLLVEEIEEECRKLSNNFLFYSVGRALRQENHRR